MVILWTNLEGERAEPNATAERPAAPDGAGQASLKRRVQVALKPSLPSLFLPLAAGKPASNTDSASLPSSLDDGSSSPDEDARLVVIRAGDLSPDSGVLVHYDEPSSRVTSSKPRATKTLPIVYGILTTIERERQNKTNTIEAET